MNNQVIIMDDGICLSLSSVVERPAIEHSPLVIVLHGLTSSKTMVNDIINITLH